MTREAAPLLGRQAELAAISEHLERGVAVVLVGEPGIGKTALANAAAGATGRRVFRGAGIGFAEWRSYLPLEQAIGAPVARGDPRAVAGDVLAAVGAGCLVLDDLHWADDDTMAVLPHLAGRCLLVLVSRTGDWTGSATIDRMTRRGRAERMTVGPLDDAAAEHLVRHLVPSMGDAAVASVVARSGGNPLALTATSRDPHAHGALETALAARIEKLSSDHRRLLALAGVLGEPVALSPAAERELGQGLMRQTDEGWVAAHHVVADLAVASLPSAGQREVFRTAAHRAATDAYAAFLLWRAGEIDEAHRRAAAAADSVEHPRERALLSALAAESAPDERLAEFVAPAMVRLLSVGELARARVLLDAIEERMRLLGDRARAQWLLADATLRPLMGDLAGAIEAASAGLDLVGPEAEETPYLLGARAGASILAFDPASARRDLEASEAFRGTDVPGSDRVRVLLAGADVVAGGTAWREILLGVLDRGRGRDPVLFCDASELLVYAAFFGEEPALARRVAAEAIAVAEADRQLGRAAQLRATLATNEVLAGFGARHAVDELRRLLADDVLDRDRFGAATLLAIGLADLGALADARTVIDDALARMDPSRSVSWSSLHWARAEVELLDLRPRAAREAARVAIAHSWPGQPAHDGSRAVDAWAGYLLGEPVVDRAWMRFDPPRLDRDGVVQLAGGEPEAALELFAKCVRKAEHYWCRLQLRARWGMAEAHRLAGRTDRAAEPLGELEQLVNEHACAGYRGWISRRPDPSALLPATATRRQAQVAALRDRGWDRRAIARFVGLAPATVDSHLQALRRARASEPGRRRARASELRRRRAQTSPVIVAPRSSLGDAAAQLQAAGWIVARSGTPPARPVAHVIDVRTEVDARQAVEAAVRGDAVAASVDAFAGAAALVDSLRHVATVEDRRALPDPLAGLDVATLVLARTLAEGATVPAAAEAAGLSRRTAYRRLDLCRQRLGAPTVREAASSIARSLEKLVPPGPQLPSAAEFGTDLG